MEAEAEAEAEKNFWMEAEAEAEAKKKLVMEAEAEAVQKFGASTSLLSRASGAADHAQSLEPTNLNSSLITDQFEFKPLN